MPEDAGEVENKENEGAFTKSQCRWGLIKEVLDINKGFAGITRDTGESLMMTKYEAPRACVRPGPGPGYIRVRTKQRGKAGEICTRDVVDPAPSAPPDTIRHMKRVATSRKREYEPSHFVESPSH